MVKRSFTITCKKISVTRKTRSRKNRRNCDSAPQKCGSTQNILLRPSGTDFGSSVTLRQSFLLHEASRLVTVLLIRTAPLSNDVSIQSFFYKINSFLQFSKINYSKVRHGFAAVRRTISSYSRSALQNISAQSASGNLIPPSSDAATQNSSGQALLSNAYFTNS